MRLDQETEQVVIEARIKGWKLERFGSMLEALEDVLADIDEHAQCQQPGTPAEYCDCWVCCVTERLLQEIKAATKYD